jgi:hypothetical protein
LPYNDDSVTRNSKAIGFCIWYDHVSWIKTEQIDVVVML